MFCLSAYIPTQIVAFAYKNKIYFFYHKVPFPHTLNFQTKIRPLFKRQNHLFPKLRHSYCILSHRFAANVLVALTLLFYSMNKRRNETRRFYSMHRCETFCCVEGKWTETCPRYTTPLSWICSDTLLSHISYCKKVVTDILAKISFN